MPRMRRVEPRLHVRDLRASIAFYTDTMGFKLDGIWPDDDPQFAMLRRDDAQLQLVADAFEDAPANDAAKRSSTLWIDVDSASVFAEQLRDRIIIEWGPEVYWYGRREFAFRDPDGHLIILSEETEEPATCVDVDA